MAETVGVVDFNKMLALLPNLNKNQAVVLLASLQGILGENPSLGVTPDPSNKEGTKDKKYVFKDKKVHPLAVTQANHWREKTGKVLSGLLQTYGVEHRKDGFYIQKDLRVAHLAVHSSVAYGKEVKTAHEAKQPLPALNEWKATHHAPLLEMVRNEPDVAEPGQEIYVIDDTLPGEAPLKKRKI
jgi:hypothetical protein